MPYFRRDPIPLLEIACGPHGMNEVIGRLDPIQGRFKRFWFQKVTVNYFSGLIDTWPEVRGMTGETTHTYAFALEYGEQTAADVAGGTCKEDEGVTFHGIQP